MKYSGKNSILRQVDEEETPAKERYFGINSTDNSEYDVQVDKANANDYLEQLDNIRMNQNDEEILNAIEKRFGGYFHL